MVALGVLGFCRDYCRGSIPSFLTKRQLGLSEPFLNRGLLEAQAAPRSLRSSPGTSTLMGWSAPRMDMPWAQPAMRALQNFTEPSFMVATWTSWVSPNSGCVAHIFGQRSFFRVPWMSRTYLKPYNQASYFTPDNKNRICHGKALSDVPFAIEFGRSEGTAP